MKGDIDDDVVHDDDCDKNGWIECQRTELEVHQIFFFSLD